MENMTCTITGNDLSGQTPENVFLLQFKQDASYPEINECVLDVGAGEGDFLSKEAVTDLAEQIKKHKDILVLKSLADFQRPLFARAPKEPNKHTCILTGKKLSGHVYIDESHPLGGNGVHISVLDQVENLFIPVVNPRGAWLRPLEQITTIPVPVELSNTLKTLGHGGSTINAKELYELIRRRRRLSWLFREKKVKANVQAQKDELSKLQLIEEKLKPAIMAKLQPVGKIDGYEGPICPVTGEKAVARIDQFDRTLPYLLRPYAGMHVSATVFASGAECGFGEHFFGNRTKEDVIAKYQQLKAENSSYFLLPPIQKLNTCFISGRRLVAPPQKGLGLKNGGEQQRKKRPHFFRLKGETWPEEMRGVAICSQEFMRYCSKFGAHPGVEGLELEYVDEQIANGGSSYKVTVAEAVAAKDLSEQLKANVQVDEDDKAQKLETVQVGGDDDEFED